MLKASSFDEEEPLSCLEAGRFDLHVGCFAPDCAECDPVYLMKRIVNG